MADEITLGANNFKWLHDSNTRGLTLIRNNNSYGTYSLGEEYGTPYVVPASHRTIILKIGFFGNSGDMQIYDSTSSDSATGTVLFDTNSDVDNFQCDVFWELAAGHYFNVTVPDPKTVQVIAMAVETGV